MGNKIFYVYAIRDSNSDGCAEAFLNLPASPYEMLDAMDKLRLDDGKSVKFGVEEFYRFGSLVPHLSEKYGLCDLNALAQKLSELDDRQEIAFEGLLKMEPGEKGSPIGLPRLIDLAYSADCCHVVDEALNDSQLGRFCAENGFVPGVDSLSDAVFDMLDFERIGREHRQREGGVLVERDADHPGGYVELRDALEEVYKTLDLPAKAPDYTILLEVSRGFFRDPSYDSGKTVQLRLPAAPEALDAALTALDVWDWREAGWTCLDCRAPALMEAISDGEAGIGFLNQMAQRLADMEPKELIEYKALLSATECKSLHHAEQLMDTLDQYTFSPQYSSPVEVARGELPTILSSDDLAQIIPHLNLYQYGQTLIQHCGGMLTDYGLIRRNDGQPIQAIEQQPQQGRMEMC